MELLPIIIGPLLTALVQVFKKRTRMSGSVALVCVAFLCGVVYIGLQRRNPEILQITSEFVGQAGFVAVIVYEFFIKNLQPK